MNPRRLLWLRWVLALLLLAGTLARAQEASSYPAPARAAFELDIQAPEELRTLLQRHLELLRYRELGDLSDGELARLLTAAQQDARDLVGTLGYFAPDVRFEQLPEPPATAARRLRLSVAPGEPTQVSAVHIRFSGAIDSASDPAAQALRQQIQTHWSLRAGLRFSQTAWDNAKQQALRLLSARRYPAAKFSASLADIDPLQHSAELSLTLDSGPAYRFGPLLVDGLQHYDSEFVARLARLPLGADYDQTQLVQAQQRLSDSGFFDSVFVSLDTTGDPQAAPVHVQLREAKLQKAVFGVGASTDSGARLSLEHTHHQVPGIGWNALSKLSLDRETRSLSSDWTAPADEANWRWVGGALLQSQQVGSYTVNSQRLRAGRSQSGERIDRNYYLQYDRARNASTDASVTDALSANYAFTLRRFDSLLFPSSGWGLGVEVGGGSTLGSPRDPYARVLARWLGLQPLGSSSAQAPIEAAGVSRLALRAEAGAVIASAGATLPSTQLFLTGGDNTVRGYGYHDIGVTLADGSTTVGRYLAAGSVEWQRPITGSARLRDWESTLFLDAGAVADKAAALRAKVGVGAGLRWRSPVGPLQIDLAYGVAVKHFRLHMTVGFSF
jgi:translocation and assembly module TamA